MSIGNKIKNIRLLRGYTQKKLGELLDLSDSRVRQYELDIRTPKLDQLKNFAEVLEVPIEYFNNNDLDSADKIMHLLFDLESDNAINLVKTEIDGKTRYAITFEDPVLNYLLNEWNTKKSDTSIKIENTLNKESVEKEYSIWKAEFPNSLSKISYSTDTNHVSLLASEPTQKYEKK